MAEKPCKKCGHCPACGRGGHQFYGPYWQYIPPTPLYPHYGTGDFPTRFGTHTVTSGTTSIARGNDSISSFNFN